MIPNTVRLLLILCLIFGGIVIMQSTKTRSGDKTNEATDSSRSLPSAVSPMQPDVTNDYKEQSISPSSINYQKNTDSFSFVYPNASVVGDGIYESSDNPEAITNWYQEKIQASGMKTTSFIKTRTNGKIKNRLVGSSESGTIDITITKNTNDSSTTISIAD